MKLVYLFFVIKETKNKFRCQADLWTVTILDKVDAVTILIFLLNECKKYKNLVRQKQSDFFLLALVWQG